MEVPKISENSVQFLLAEFNSLQNRVKSYEEIKSSRVNYLLLVFAASGAIISASTQIELLKTYFSETVLLISLFVWLLGWFTFKGLLDYSIAIVIFYRRAGRIRKWFVLNDNSIKSFVAFEPNDDRPKFTVSNRLLHWRGGESVLMLLNSFAIAIMAGTSLLYIPKIQTVVSLIVSIPIGILFWIYQIYYVHSKMKEAQNSEWAQKAIFFPTVKKN